MMKKYHYFILLSLLISPLCYAKVYNTTDYGYNYKFCNSNYCAYFKNNPISVPAYMIISKGIESDFGFQQLDLRTSTDSIIRTVSMPQTVNPIINDNSIIYPNLYGSGISAVYNFTRIGLREELRIDSRSSLPNISQKNASLAWQFIISTNSSKLMIDNASWDRSTTVETENRVDIYDAKGNRVYVFAKPYSYDSNRLKTNNTFQFKKSANKLYVTKKTSMDWFNESERKYPAFIEPSIFIPIVYAEILNSSMGFIADVYNLTKYGDNLTTDVNLGETLRVTFLEEINSSNILLIRMNSTNATLKIYPLYNDSIRGQSLGNITNIFNDTYYRLELSNLIDKTDKFDLVPNKRITVNHVIDPSGSFNSGSIPDNYWAYSGENPQHYQIVIDWQDPDGCGLYDDACGGSVNAGMYFDNYGNCYNDWDTCDNPASLRYCFNVEEHPELFEGGHLYWGQMGVYLSGTGTCENLASMSTPNRYIQLTNCIPPDSSIDSRDWIKNASISCQLGLYSYPASGYISLTDRDYDRNIVFRGGGSSAEVYINNQFHPISSNQYIYIEGSNPTNSYSYTANVTLYISSTGSLT